MFGGVINGACVRSLAVSAARDDRANKSVRARGRPYRSRQSTEAPNSVACEGNSRAASPWKSRRIRWTLSSEFFRNSRSSSCRQYRWRWHEIKDRVRHEQARYRGRRSGEPLRQRHRSARRAPTFLFGLHRVRETRTESFPPTVARTFSSVPIAPLCIARSRHGLGPNALSIEQRSHF